MATIKVEQGSINELKSAITFAAEQTSQAANMVSKAIDGMSGMSFSAKPGLESELTSLKNRLNQQARLSQSYCRAVQETVDAFTQVDDSAGSSAEGVWRKAIAISGAAVGSAVTAEGLSFFVKERLKKILGINGDYIDGASGAESTRTPNIDGNNQGGGTASTSGNSAGQVSTASIVDGASAQLGKAYVSGGDGVNGYDCIGLVREAYRQVGIDLPRQATGNGTLNWADQGLVKDVTDQSGSPVLGDILCWYADANNKTGQPDHVAIYTGPIQTNIINGTYQGYQTDAEGYILNAGGRIDCINALNPTYGVCYIKSGYYTSGPPTDIWRAP